MDVDKALQSVEGSVATDKEIYRVLNSFRLDSYSLLDLQPGCSDDDIKRQYRKKSLLIHPDKTDNPRASELFDILKKAHSNLINEENRIKLDNKFTELRKLLLGINKWSIDDPRLQSDTFMLQWREKVKELLIEDELLNKLELKRQLKDEGELKLKLEQSEIKKSLQKLINKDWEDNRDNRVGNWRNYSSKVQKKKLKLKNKKLKVLV